MSKCIFKSDGSSDGESSEWSAPIKLSDSVDFEVSYSSVKDSPGNPNDNPNNWMDEITDTDDATSII